MTKVLVQVEYLAYYIIETQLRFYFLVNLITWYILIFNHMLLLEHQLEWEFKSVKSAIQSEIELDMWLIEDHQQMLNICN